MPTSKLHHYVPQMLLKRFSSEPDRENAPLFRLDVKTGQPARTSVRNEAAIMHYNRVANISGVGPSFVEETFAALEGVTAPIFEKIAAGLEPSNQERLNLALFVYLQHQRTPRAREWYRFMEQETGRMLLELKLSNPEVAAWFKDRDSSMTDDDAEKRRLTALEQVREGKLRVTRGWDGEVGGMFMLADKIPLMLVAEMSWTVLRAPAGAEFIISDHPVHMYDPGARGRGVGWFSSVNVEIVLPVGRRACLWLQPGSAVWLDQTVSAADVDHLNLRSYAGAEWRIYGRNQATLQKVRKAAKNHSALIAELRPHPPHMFVAERMEGAAAPHKLNVTVGPEHAKIRRFRRAE